VDPAVTRRFDAVIFDLFGTLVYEFPRADWDEWLEASAAVLEVDADAYKDAWSATAIERQTGRVGDMPEHVRTLAARAGGWPDESQVAEVLEMRAGLYRTWFEPRPGALEIVREMRDRSMPTGLISMCAPDTPALWRASPFAGLIDVEVFSCEVGLRKPEPEIYLEACELLGVEPSRCFYVGDGAYGELSGATAVGMTAVLIRDPTEEGGEALRPEAEDWHGPRVDDLREIAALVFGSGA
jgi:putative hydrolase of the HAD superfamily